MNCPREIEIDRLVGGSLEPAEAAALESHVASCPACAAEKARARAEADAYRKRLAPLRLAGGIKEEIMASLPDETAVSSRPAPRFGVVRWAAAAVILAALGTVLLSSGKDPGRSSGPSLSPLRGSQADPHRLTSMEVTRAKDIQKLQAAELPFLSRQLEEAGFWIEADGTLEKFNKDWSEDWTIHARLSRVRDGVEDPLDVTLVRDPAAVDQGYLSVSNGKRSGGRNVPREIFDRLWEILQRAMNPLQIYLEKTTIKAGDPIPAKAVYRGGLEPSWDMARNRVVLNLMLLKRDKDNTLLDDQGRPIRVNKIGSSLDPTGVMPGAAFAIDLDPPKKFSNLARPGRYGISLGWDNYTSEQVEVVVTDGQGEAAAARSRLLSLEVTRSSKGFGPPSETQTLRPEELPFLAAGLESLDLWKRSETLKPQKLPDLDPDRVMLMKCAVEWRGVKEEWTIFAPVYPQQTGGWTIVMHGPRKGQADVSKEVFDRFWSILEREINPLRLHLEKTTFRPGEAMPALFVYRGGVEGWDAAIEEGTLVNSATLTVLRGQQERVPVTARQVKIDAARPDPFTTRADLSGMAAFQEPGRYVVFWGAKGRRSELLEIQILADAVDGRHPTLADALAAGRKENKPVLCYFYADWPGRVTDWHKMLGDAFDFGEKDPFGGKVILAQQDFQANGQDLRGRYGIDQLRIMDFVLLLDPFNDAPGLQPLVQAMSMTPAGIRKTVEVSLETWEDHGSARQTFAAFVDAVGKEDLEAFKKLLWPAQAKALGEQKVRDAFDRYVKQARKAPYAWPGGRTQNATGRAAEAWMKEIEPGMKECCFVASHARDTGIDIDEGVTEMGLGIGLYVVRVDGRSYAAPAGLK